jgi:organic hydroperoxide reductase OsmC/OhrA
MPQYPIPFEAVSQAHAGIAEGWTIQSGPQSAACAVPPEFGGGGKGFSPEDLFAQALLNCFVGTFQVYAANSKVTFENLSAKAKLDLDLDESRKPVMKRIKIEAEIRGASHPDRAELLAKKAAQSGFILNSVKTEVQFECRLI